jgi:hypothetical protein
MKTYLFFLFTLLILTGYSQNTKENSGVVIIKDKKIDDLIKNKSNIRRISTAGYRVQIYFSTDKDKVQDLRMKFIKQYPKMETYITFDAPNYILRVGDFTEKNDAERFKKEIFREYPENFILKTAINVPNDDEDNWDSKEKSDEVTK